MFRRKPKIPVEISGNPDDLDDSDLDDPEVRRLALAMYEIREEQRMTARQLEAIDAKIEALRCRLPAESAM